MSFDQIEKVMDGMKCANDCGGTVSMQDGLMMCSVCKYGASLRLDDVMGLRDELDAQIAACGRKK